MSFGKEISVPAAQQNDTFIPSLHGTPDPVFPMHAGNNLVVAGDVVSGVQADHRACYPAPQHAGLTNGENTTTLTRVLGYFPWGTSQTTAPTRGLVEGRNGEVNMAQREYSSATDLGMCSIIETGPDTKMPPQGPHTKATL